MKRPMNMFNLVAYRNSGRLYNRMMERIRP